MSKYTHADRIEIDAAIGLYREGYKVDVIASALGRHFTTVYEWFRNNGVQLRTTPSWNKYRKVARQRNELKVKVAQQFAINI